MYYLNVNYYYEVRIILYLYLFIHTYIYHLKFFWLNLQIINYYYMIGNVSIISDAYRRLFNFGAETLLHDYDLERAFN